MSDEVFQGRRYLLVVALLEVSTQVFLVNLPVPQKGAEASVENLRGTGEGQRPDLRLVPELPDAGGVIGVLAAHVVEADALR